MIEIKAKLSIGIISSPFLKTPPSTYGGLERVVADLGYSLAQMGHDATIFAANGSYVEGCKVVEFGSEVNKVHVNWLEAERRAYYIYRKKLLDFDIIHDHSWFGLPYYKKIGNADFKICHTHHGYLNPIYLEYKKEIDKMNLFGISKYTANIHSKFLNTDVKYVYNGINLDLYKYKDKDEKIDRLLFVGRLTNVKQPHVAIEVARRVNMPIDIIGGSFVEDMKYLEYIKSFDDGYNVRVYIDASDEFKVRLMQENKCLLFTSKMDEPFGLVAVEANACGTPVVALRDGAIPEVIMDNVNGYVCDDIEQMVEAVKKIDNIKSENCRKIVEERFSRKIMAKAYEVYYKEILEGKEW